ncbi:MAG: YggS family pyridoxal phosphate-dependent enzyme [Acidobacteriia bacterium]|nr:YggS family pyridoxal phosphate-dependent enzyme [Terriglobia bacterium]
MSIAQNLNAVRERIAAAARRAARSPDDIALMAVTKTFGPDAIRAAYDAGQRLFGENRVQEFAEKAPALRDLADADFHMIGHLQTNKAGKAVEVFSAVDSVDSLRLAEKLNAAAATARKRLPVLIELNLGGEESKSGLNPVSLDFGALLESAARLDHLDFRGLMTIPPFTADPEGSRPFFRRLREIRDNIARRNLPAIRLDTLSMGMSHDFEVAIEQGSTCVRLGTAIFGERTAKA